MPDSKITALTSISTSTDPANDPLVIVDVSDTSMAATGTTKKVTLNQLLGASGTATLASATITGDLTVDTSTLKVDSANNVVGIGTASPTAIAGYTSLTINTPTTGSFIDLNVAGVNKTRLLGTSSNFNIETAGTIPITMMIGGQNQYRVDTAGVFTWYDGAGGTRMTLNSTGLGVGVVPSAARFEVGGGDGTQFYIRSTGTASARIRGFTNSAEAGVIGFLNGGGIYFDVNGERMRIDTSGNVGVGVTPSAWGASRKPIELGGTYGALSGNLALELYSNAYFNGTNYIYRNSSVPAALTSFNGAASGGWAWNIAGNGTAGNAITWTQAMTLDASGTLLVGTTSAGASGFRCYLSTDSGTTKWSVGPYVSATNFAIVASGSAGGVYLNGTTATSWTALSDERFKDIIEPISNAVSKVGSLRAVIGKIKGDETNTRKSFLIAQDVESVLPEAVDSSNPDRLGLAYTDVIPLLVAAIKELTARVQTLETR